MLPGARSNRTAGQEHCQETDDKFLILKRVSIPPNNILGHLKNKTLKDCSEVCQHYPRCNSYQYNKKDKLCDLSNATQATPELRPNNGKWDTYIFKEAHRKIDCGPPKDVAAAKKSYTSTTYKSEVTYKCPMAHVLKSVCKEDNKWTSVVSSCKDTLIQFVKIKDAFLDTYGKSPLNQKNATPEECATKCLSYSNCLSIEMDNENGKCFLSTKSATSSKTLKGAKRKDYYQRIKLFSEIFKFKNAYIPKHDTFGQLKNVSLNECKHVCYQTSECNSYEYNEITLLCDLSNVTHLTHDLQPNNEGWDIYIINPVFLAVDCGPPKDVVGALKSYKTTTFKSEVMYTCENGDQLKSTCEKNNRWSPVENACNVSVLYFVKIKNALLDVSKKTLLKKKNVTADACAEECVSDKSCLSFEIIKKSGKCYLSKKSAATSKNIKVTKHRDYYQRVKHDGKHIKFIKVTLQRRHIFGRLKDKDLKECNQACHDFPGCISYEYRAKDKYCDLSNETHELIPKGVGWETYLINKVFSKVDCGPPKDIAIASKSYNTTSYKSEVTYSCPGGHELKAICNEYHKWAPEVTACNVAETHFVKVKSAALDVPKKTLWNKENVTEEACAEKCVSDKKCLSFEIIKKSGKCYLSKESAATSKKMKVDNSRNYYQLVEPKGDLFTFKNTIIVEKDTFETLKNVSLKECYKTCLQNPGCNSFEYKEEAKICNHSSVNHLTYDLKPSKDSWDTYIINPVHEKVNCGLPKDVPGTLKFYKTTTYKSEATYTCSKGEQLKSTCEINNKWTPIVSNCTVAQIHFVKVNGAAMDLSKKTLWDKKNVTAEACAERCVSDETCLSFEITKESGKCYLSERSAAASEKIKVDKGRDYYQQVKPHDKPFVLKKVNIPKQDILKRFKNVNLKKCNEACHQYLECNSYQYNEKTKLCDLSNVTQLTDKLKPSDGSWDVYVINPVYTETDCGQPKDISDASKSYNTTTFHSEVSYSCPGGHKLKAICKEGNRWLPVMTSCKVAETHFVKIKSAALNISGKTLWKKAKVTAEACAERCVSDETCVSFEIMRKTEECYLAKKSAATSKEIEVDDSRDYYQQVKLDEDIFTFKNIILDVQDVFEPLTNLSLKECNGACRQTPGCNSYKYNEKRKSCHGNNATYLIHDLKPNKKGWDTYIINPVLAKVNCGTPKEVVGASKFYSTTKYKSEVIYICPGDETLKSVCGKDNKWTSVAPICEDTKNQFMKIKDAFLDVPNKTLVDSENVTAETCIEKCLSDKTCLSFELTKESGKCYLLKENAASSKKLKPNENRDYYQRIKPNEEHIMLKKVSIPGRDILEVLRNIDLKKCNKACHQYPGCNSYAYDEKKHICSLSDVSQLTGELKPNNVSADIYIINPAYTKVNCGPPNDVIGASKSYKTTTYKSEVTYSCPKGEKLKSICNKDNKWSPVAPVCKVYAHINCGPPKEVVGALMTYKTTIYKSNVTYTCPKGEQLKSTCERGSRWTYVVSACNVTKIYFVQVRGAFLDIAGKVLVDEENVTAEACAEKCLTDKTCLSFEINKDNEKCYLSKESATHSQKIKTIKAIDYYQRVDPNGEPLVLKNTSIPSKHTFAHLENLTVDGCQEACYLYSDCSSYSFNIKAKVCELSNVTELSNLIHHDSESLEVHVLNPAHRKINCGPPKDITGAKKSYTATTYKAEVIYTCPGGETLESVCKEDNKWTAVASDCRDTQMYFVKVSGAILHVSGKILWNKNVTAEDCANECLSDETCFSFEISRGSGKCYISMKSAASSNKLKPTNKRDYYQRIRPEDELFIIKRTSIPGQDTFGTLKNVSLKECHQACHQTPGCNSYEYNERAQICDRSNATHLTHDLQPSKWSWDTYIVNPIKANINCGLPKEVVGAVKFYKTTTYKSEVTYTCPKGEQLKSTCEKNNKWSPMVETCKDPQIHFVKVNGAALGVSGKILWYKKNVTAEACGEKCMSDETCLSFEIIKESGKCYISEESAATSTNMKTDNSRDYYQRVKPDVKPVMLKRISLPEEDTLKQFENMDLNECNKACYQSRRCNSYQYNQEDKTCRLNKVTQLTEKLKPNNGNQDAYFLAPAFKNINCGPPKRVANALKSFKTTTYNSEVIYTCPGGNELKATCKEDNQWVPKVSSCKVAQYHFMQVKDAILEVSGKILWKQEKVTADMCAEKCLSDITCLSFEITEENGKCYLSKESAAISKKINTAKSRDYYQRINLNDEFVAFKKTFIPGHDAFPQLTNMSLMQCYQACHKTLRCNSFEYNERSKLCNRSNVTQLTHNLIPNKEGWDIYLINTGFQKIDCGPPKDVAGAVKIYKSTTFKSIVTYNCPRGGVFKSMCEKDKKWTPVPPTCEAYADIDCGTPKEVVGAVKSYETTIYKSVVTYTCPKGEQLKSICETNNKWTPVAKTCKDSEIHFVKVKGGAMGVSGKILWNKKKVTAEACARKCLIDERCLSFEMSKKNRKCYFSKETAATSKKMKKDNSRDYYQRVKPDEEPIIFKKVSIPKKFILEKLKNKTLQECNETCYQNSVCSSYEYNKKAKLCALSNMTQLSGKLQPNYGSWDTFLIQPAYTKVDCGQPKDIDRTLMSYTTTTYKSEVTYTCQEGEKLKSVCKEDHKWTPVVSSCKVSKIYFVKVKGAVLDTPKKTLWDKKNVTVDACAQKCLSYKNCLSFDINKVSGDCYFSKASAAFSKKLKPTSGRDYYQRLRPYYELYTIKNAAIPGQANLGQLRNVELKECEKACYQIPRCKSYEYNVRAKICYHGNVTHLIHDLEPSKSDSDTYIINPAFSNVDCGLPKDVVGALKSYKSTTYKSEVTYTCPEGNQLKSTCEKHKIWSQVTPTCNDLQINFAEVKGAILNIPGKILWNKKNVTVEACAEKCLSDKKCLAFEINKEKGKCYLSPQTAASSNKIAPTKSRDYYQRVKPGDMPFVMKNVNVRKKVTLGQLKRVNLKQCGKACGHYAGCNSYQYNEKAKLCDLSNVTQLTDEFKPNNGKWNIYVVNPVVSKVDCGPPKDIVGASKSYSTTTYKSEVTYICREGEELKAVCKEDKKWAPEVSCKVAEVHFVKVKGAALAVSGKTLWDKQNVTVEVCAEKCLSEKICLSFEINKENGNCYLSKQTAASSKKIKKSKSRDYYQRINPDDDFLTFKRINILKQDTLGRLRNVSLAECDEACYELAECKSYEYNEKTKLCDRSNVTQLTHDLQPNVWGWDIHIINPVLAKINCGPPNDVVGTKKSYTTTTYKSEVTYTCPGGRKLKSACKRDTKWTSVAPCEAYADIDCGNPKDIVGASKSYIATTYKSEVTYTCPEGGQLKSTCETNNKWTLVAESCKDPQIHFAKVRSAALDVSGKRLWSKKKVTAEDCAEKCLSDKTCLSFEITKESGKCYLSHESAALSKKMKLDTSRDYYQQVKHNKEPIMFQNVSIPKTTFGQFEDMTLKECNETCYQYEGCNTFLYNEQDTLCDLSNVTQLTGELKPNKKGWNIYIVNPDITRVECGPPKDVVGAKKSYTNTSYKSEVTYTCPGKEILKSLCKENSKWTPVASNCKVTKLHFVKVKGAVLDTPKKTLWDKKNVTADACAQKCLFYADCLMFEIDKGSRTCYFSKQSAASSKKLKPMKGRDYYQRIKSHDEILPIKSTSIPGQDTFGQLENVSLKECDKVCHQTPGCKSYEYKEKAKTCDRSNATHLTHDLEPNKEGWDTYIISPDFYNTDCGPPKEVVDAVKTYKTTTYKSEVSYTCPKGEQLKSTCGKDNKWTPVASACNDILIHFVKIKDAALDETGKTLWNKQDVTADECAEKCLSDQKCLSFELNKENRKCYLSNNAASSSKKIKKAKNKDYYQRVKSDVPLKLKRVSVPRMTTLGQLKNKTLNECSEACFQYIGCSTYQYNEQTKLCDLSNMTQLSNELKPNNGSWDIYMTLPVLTTIDCGPPKDVSGTLRSYNTTSYESNVTYTCQDGEILKAACKENNKWAPEVSCKVAQIHFVKVKGAALDVSGKTLWKEKKVTPEACANECLTDKKCLSFEIMKKSGMCYLSKETAATSKEMKSDKSKDYYQKVKRNYSLGFISGILFPFFPEICDSICTSLYIDNHF
ncbi:uncharacterized protein LOC128248841 [Octopus bimaculoides]|uniref:uncharacterized protein LOC128248841 n=1 Tax=Octopus bimaculoides TaxID=37653 RepID=UPI0022E675C7|nr:uncharacterized protein LOC128248841 [Octopus bimaculoides]